MEIFEGTIETIVVKRRELLTSSGYIPIPCAGSILEILS